MIVSAMEHGGMGKLAMTKANRWGTGNVNNNAEIARKACMRLARETESRLRCHFLHDKQSDDSPPKTADMLQGIVGV